jgi:hypothetical protein
MRRIGERAMTSSERQQRFLAKLKVPQVTAAQGEAEARARMLDQMRKYPDWIAVWLLQQLGYRSLGMLYEAIGRVLEKAKGSNNTF